MDFNKTIKLVKLHALQILWNSGLSLIPTDVILFNIFPLWPGLNIWTEFNRSQGDRYFILFIPLYDVDVEILI